MPTNEQLEALLRAQIDELSRSLDRWTDTSMPAYKRTILLKSQKEVELERIRRLLQSQIPQGGDSTSEHDKAGCWKDFHGKFMDLANEEAEIVQKTGKDLYLRAYCTYKEHAEVMHERGKPEQGPFCLLKTPETGLWIVSDGVNENFHARFHALAARTGTAIGCPKGADPEDFWLHQLYFNLLNNNSDQLFAASKDGGLIRRICVASATFCSRLERKAFGTSESAQGRDFATELAKIAKHTKGTKRSLRQPPALTVRRAKAVSRFLRELRTVKPKIYNQGYYEQVKREYPNFSIFKLAQQNSDVKQWIENIQDRRGIVGLAQEIAARDFKVSLATVKTDWSHRRKPRPSPKKRHKSPVLPSFPV